MAGTTGTLYASGILRDIYMSVHIRRFGKDSGKK